MTAFCICKTIVRGLSAAVHNKKGEIFVTERTGKRIALAGVLTVFTAILVFAWDPLFSALGPVFTGLAIAYLAAPFVRWLSDRGVRRVWGILLFYLLFLGLLSLIVLLIAPQIVKNISELLAALPAYAEKWTNFYHTVVQNLLGDDLARQGIEALDFGSYIRQALSAVAAGVTGTVVFAVNLIAGMVVAFYILLDTIRFRDAALSLIPRSKRGWWVSLFRDLSAVLSGFLRGQLIVAVFIGITSAVGLAVLDIPYAALLGFIAGLLDVIPCFGAVLGAVPAVLTAWAISPVRAIITAVLFLVLQQFESNVLSPRIVGNSVGVHPVAIMVAVLAAGAVFGVTGLFFAVPAAGMLKILLYRFLDWYIREPA